MPELTPNVLDGWTTFLWGVIAMGDVVAAFFFVKFWRRTRDRLFAYFAAAFATLAVQRLALMGVKMPDARDAESVAWVYLLRLAAFALILLAIVGKNRE